MKFVEYKNNVKMIRPSDDHFYIKNKFVVTPRAGFEIVKECPREYKLVIQDCIDRGWLKPVATVTEREMLFIGLTK